MRSNTFHRRIAAIHTRLQPTTKHARSLPAVIWLPHKDGEVSEPDTRLPLIIYDPRTGEPLPAYAALAARITAHERAGYRYEHYGFNPDVEGTEA